MAKKRTEYGALSVEDVAIDSIKPYENNPRTNDDAVDAVAASIREFGFRSPIVVDADGVIICGHTRLKAATKLGLAKVPVHVARDLPPEKVRALRIADNKTGSLAEWDVDRLDAEIADVVASGEDPTLTGFDAEDIAAMLAGADASSAGEPEEKNIRAYKRAWFLIESTPDAAMDVERVLAGLEGVQDVTIHRSQN